MQIVNSKLKYFNMIILDVFSDFSSVESEFLYRREVWYKADPCFNFSCDFFIKPKRAAISFHKKVVSLNFGFDSLGNEQNFLSNQKAGELMDVTRNKLFRDITCDPDTQLILHHRSHARWHD